MSFKRTKEVEIGAQRIAEALRRVHARLENPTHSDPTHDAIGQCALLADAVAVLAKNLNDLRAAVETHIEP